MERKKGSCQPKRGIIFAIAAVGLILGFAAPEIGAQAQKERAPSVEGATYVGSKNCELCHKEIYLKWNATLHRRKIQPAGNENEESCQHLVIRDRGHLGDGRRGTRCGAAVGATGSYAEQ